MVSWRINRSSIELKPLAPFMNRVPVYTGAEIYQKKYDMSVVYPVTKVKEVSMKQSSEI
jgi:hypothetical protein